MATKEMTKEKTQEKTEGQKMKTVTRAIKKYSVVRALDDNDKIAPQAKLIVDALAKSKVPLTVKELTELALAAGLKTRQEPSRIFVFYRNSLVNAGIVKETVVETKEEVPVAAQTSKKKPAGKDEKGKKVSA